MAQEDRVALETVQLWGQVCGGTGACDDCVLGAIGQASGVTCQEFAVKHPDKFLAILREKADEPITYYNEYCMRFPHSNLSIEGVADCVCRKAVFEGYLGCEGGDCVACWNTIYTQDITESDEYGEDFSDNQPEDGSFL